MNSDQQTSESPSGKRGYPVHHPVFPIVPTEEENQALQEKTRLLRGFTPYWEAPDGYRFYLQGNLMYVETLRRGVGVTMT